MPKEPTKISIKVGDLEVTYSGSDGFPSAHAHIKKLLETASNIHNGHSDSAPKSSSIPSIPSKKNEKASQETVDSFYEKIMNDDKGIGEGAALAWAAAKSLKQEGINPFTRKQLLARMKPAINYTQKNHGKNLTKIINQLTTKNKKGKKVLIDRGSSGQNKLYGIA